MVIYFLAHTVKNKITYRRERIVTIQRNLRKCAAMSKYRPLYKGLVKVRKSFALCAEIRQQVDDLKADADRQQAQQEFAAILEELRQLEQQLKANAVPGFADPAQRQRQRVGLEYQSRCQTVDARVGAINAKIERLIQSMKLKLKQQEELVRAQVKIEAEKRQMEAEEQKRRDDDERRKRKEEIETRRKSEEIKVQQQDVSCRSGNCLCKRIDSLCLSNRPIAIASS